MTTPGPTPAFDVAVDRRDETLVAAPAGELDIATAPLLQAELRQHEGYRQLVLDLRRLSFMDSSGLRLLVAEQSRAAEEGYELRMLKGGEEVSRLLRLTRLDEKLPFAEASELGL